MPFPGIERAKKGLNYFSFSQNQSEDEDEEDLIEDQPDSFDSFKIVKRKGKKHFCKCKRGPMGHPGAPGIEGTCQNANTFGLTIVDSIFILKTYIYFL